MCEMKVFNAIYMELQKLKREGSPIVIGINGMDYSGKTTFSKHLSEFLEGKGRLIQTIHVDDFYNGKELNYRGDHLPEYYYKNSYDIGVIANQLLNPLRTYNHLDANMLLWDEKTDSYTLPKRYVIPSHSTVLIEGVFLFQPSIKPLLDYKIFLNVELQEIKRRALIRNVHENPHSVLSELCEKFIPAHHYYMKDANPLEDVEMFLDISI
jgi:uridine kinase